MTEDRGQVWSKQMLNEEGVYHDMGCHFANRLRRLITETADTCFIAKMELPQVISLVTTPLICETILAANAIGKDKTWFLALSSRIYDALEMDLKEKKATRKRKPNANVDTPTRRTRR